MRRRRPSPATIIAVVALVVALGGTALAASRYIITSTHQIKPSVLRALRGAQGPLGPPGPTGPPGKEANINALETRLQRLCFAISLAAGPMSIIYPPDKGAEEVQAKVEERLKELKSASGCP